MILEKTLESHLDWEEIKPVSPKGNQPWIFIGRTDAEAETPIFWLPDAKSRLIEKDLYAREDWKQMEKWVADDEMVRWHHQLNGHEFEQLWQIVKERWAWSAVVHGVAKSHTTWLNNSKVNHRKWHLLQYFKTFFTYLAILVYDWNDF